MPRDERAYLADIVESCEAIQNAIKDLTLQSFRAIRQIVSFGPPSSGSSFSSARP